MKKTILTFALLAVTLLASAQTIKVSYKQGETATYNSKVEYSVGVPMQGEMKATTDITVKYNIVKAGADGYTVEMSVVDFSVSGDNDIAENGVDVNFYKGVKKTPALLKLDPKGSVTSIENAEAVLASVAEATINGINDLYTRHPELDKALPKTKALLAADGQLTVENLLKKAREASVFSLNGKDIESGKKVDEKLMDMIKVKSTYTVETTATGLDIKRTSESDMTEDDVKNLVKEQVTKSGGDESAYKMVESAWGQLKAMGMTRLELTSNGTSAYTADGWLSSQNENSTTSVIGSTVKYVSTTTRL